MRHHLIAISTMLLAGSVLAQDISTHQYRSTETTNTARRVGLTFIQASDHTLHWRFTRGGVGMTLTGGTPKFYYSDSARSWQVVVTGSLENATNGMVQIPFTPTQLNTNSNDEVFDYVLLVSSSSQDLARAYGNLTILENIAITGAGTLPIQTNLNWRIYTGYENTATDGPYRSGSNITFRTGGDGACSIDFGPTLDSAFTNAVRAAQTNIVDTDAQVLSDVLSNGMAVAAGQTINDKTDTSSVAPDDRTLNNSAGLVRLRWEALTVSQDPTLTNGIATKRYVDTATNGMYEAGVTYTDAATNGIYEAGVVYADSVTNGLYEAAEAAWQAYTIAATSGIYEAGVTYTDAATNGIYEAAEAAWQAYTIAATSGIYEAAADYADANDDDTTNASLIAAGIVPTNYTAVAGDVASHLGGIDAALASAGGGGTVSEDSKSWEIGSIRIDWTSVPDYVYPTNAGWGLIQQGLAFDTDTRETIGPLSMFTATNYSGEATFQFASYATTTGQTACLLYYGEVYAESYLTRTSTAYAVLGTTPTNPTMHTVGFTTSGLSSNAPCWRNWNTTCTTKANRTRKSPVCVNRLSC